MIGLDTNILVRYLVQDDPVQSAKATELIERRLTPDNPGFVSIVAMVETVWVLDRSYGFAAQEITAAIERMLQAETLVIDNEQEVFSAMTALQDRWGEFADAVIAHLEGRQAAPAPSHSIRRHYASRSLASGDGIEISSVRYSPIRPPNSRSALP